MEFKNIKKQKKKQKKFCLTFLENEFFSQYFIIIFILTKRFFLNISLSFSNEILNIDIPLYSLTC